MRALVVYESMYGSTRVVAGNIAEGLRAGHDVILVPVGEATGDLLAWADLVIVGGPTHMHRLSTTSSRQLAAQAAASQASGLKLDPPRPAAGGPPLGLSRATPSVPRTSERTGCLAIRDHYPGSRPDLGDPAGIPFGSGVGIGDGGNRAMRVMGDLGPAPHAPHHMPRTTCPATRAKGPVRLG